MKMSVFPAIVAVALTSLAGCSRGGDETPMPAKSEPMPQAEEAPMPRTPSPAGARVFFITPRNGALVTSPFTVEFGIEGMDVVKAGDDTPNSGHHHLLIDTDLPPLDMPIPVDEHHKHFGDGSTSTVLTLPPGKHTLQLLFADHLHIPHDPPVYSEKITITVE